MKYPRTPGRTTGHPARKEYRTPGRDSRKDPPGHQNGLHDTMNDTRKTGRTPGHQEGLQDTRKDTRTPGPQEGHQDTRKDPRTPERTPGHQKGPQGTRKDHRTPGREGIQDTKKDSRTPGRIPGHQNVLQDTRKDTRTPGHQERHQDTRKASRRKDPRTTERTSGHQEGHQDFSLIAVLEIQNRTPRPLTLSDCFPCARTMRFCNSKIASRGPLAIARCDFQNPKSHAQSACNVGSSKLHASLTGTIDLDSAPKCHQ
jgi:hypothetical protein